MEPKWIAIIVSLALGAILGYAPLIIKTIVERMRRQSRKIDLTFKIAKLRIQGDNGGWSWFHNLYLKKLIYLRDQL